MDELARIKISINTDTWDKQDLDSLLWEVLWEPLALPRHIREFFKLENPSIEFVAKQGDKIIGGLVAYWITPAEVELRHLAVHPSFQRMGIGKMLINQFRTTIKNVGGKRIRTNARNATVEFFKRCGFQVISGKITESPQFSEYGITFQLMELQV